VSRREEARARDEPPHNGPVAVARSA
jgi:hypothetical protein